MKFRKCAAAGALALCLSKTYSDRVSCTAHNLKLVIMRGVGTICGSLLLGLFYDWGNTSLGYVLFSAVAAVSVLCP